MTCLVLMIVFIAELLFYTWCRVQYTQIKYDIADLMEKNQQLSTVRDNLKIELARLKSPARISKIAREKLGLISPSAKHTIVMP
ncbi:MAG: cell division protein FtsL [Desulfobacterales bacterium]|nr:MAG: cell division protein FtsL [Desulfobacterales bacterium]